MVMLAAVRFSRPMYSPSSASENPGHWESTLNDILLSRYSPAVFKAPSASRCNVQPVPLRNVRSIRAMQPSSTGSISFLWNNATCTESKVKSSMLLAKTPDSSSSLPEQSISTHMPESEQEEGAAHSPHSPPQPSGPHSFSSQMGMQGPVVSASFVRPSSGRRSLMKFTCMSGSRLTGWFSLVQLVKASTSRTITSGNRVSWFVWRDIISFYLLGKSCCFDFSSVCPCVQ
jgi:hypothetical protein